MLIYYNITYLKTNMNMNNKQLLFIICLLALICYLIFFIVFFKQINKQKNNIQNLEQFSDNTNSNINLNNKNIWMYWETKKGSKKPEYLDLCLDTIKKHCKVTLLNEKTVHHYLPELKDRNIIKHDLDNICTLPQKADYIRLLLLKKYGGIWLDSDIIVFKPLDKLFEKLQINDFIGFGCHHGKCETNTRGYGKPANWVFGSQKNGVLISNCVEKATNIINKEPQILKKRYHCMGRELLWSEIDKLLQENSKNKNNNDENKKWKYYHFDSKCIERDSNGIKMRNNILLSDKHPDKNCEDKQIFMPVYNTAPGFPDWFKIMPKQELIKQSILFSRLINKALAN